MKFEQLSDKAKDRVRSNFSDEMLSISFWYECLLDEFVNKISSTYNVNINNPDFIDDMIIEQDLDYTSQ